jgi:hypothetical protein
MTPEPITPPAPGPVPARTTPHPGEPGAPAWSDPEREDYSELLNWAGHVPIPPRDVLPYLSRYDPREPVAVPCVAPAGPPPATIAPRRPPMSRHQFADILAPHVERVCSAARSLRAAAVGVDLLVPAIGGPTSVELLGSLRSALWGLIAEARAGLVAVGAAELAGVAEAGAGAKAEATS